MRLPIVQILTIPAANRELRFLPARAAQTQRGAARERTYYGRATGCGTNKGSARWATGSAPNALRKRELVGGGTHRKTCAVGCQDCRGGTDSARAARCTSSPGYSLAGIIVAFLT